MDVRRLFLYLALGLILIMIWTTWQAEHSAPPAQRTASPAAATANAGTAAGAQASATTGSGVVVNAATPGQAAGGHVVPAKLAAPSGATVTVHSDVLVLTIALDDATLVRAQLLKYAQSLKNKAPVSLLSPAPKDFRTVTPLLAGKGLPASLEFQAGATRYTLAANAQTLVVPLVWAGNGLRVERRFILARGSYEVRVQTEVRNSAGEPISLQPGMRIVGTSPPEAGHFWELFLPEHWTYRGPSWFDEDYNKLDAAALAEEPLDKSFSAGWIASVNQYFVAAAIPAADINAHYFGRSIQDNGYAVGYMLPATQLDSGQTRSFDMKLYLGPKIQGQLDAVAPGLSRTVDYGHATIISHPLFVILGFIHKFLGNWGWSLIILVLLIKAVFYFPQRMSARSMAKMRKVQPRLKLLKERYKDDKQKLSEATMKMYREEGANPVSGCLPMLIQVPIFIGLFYVLIYSVELRHAPWVLWIQDLSAPDPFYILPILFAVAMLVQFRLQPQAADSAQAKIMMIMPLGMAFLYAIFPSGLVLYYLLNTILNILIQWQVNRELDIPMDLIPKGWLPGKDRARKE